MTKTKWGTYENTTGTTEGMTNTDEQQLREQLRDIEKHMEFPIAISVETAILALFHSHESQIKQDIFKKVEITEDTSDGYHTFKELYEFRKLYNAALFNQWADMDIYQIHKSKKHHDGEFCFGGSWFIVMATLPTGQISNHYEMKDWDLFRCEERERAEEWDGHTAQDVATRLRKFLTKPELRASLKALEEEESK